MRIAVELVAADNQSADLVLAERDQWQGQISELLSRGRQDRASRHQPAGRFQESSTCILHGDDDTHAFAHCHELIRRLKANWTYCLPRTGIEVIRPDVRKIKGRAAKVLEKFCVKRINRPK